MNRRRLLIRVLRLALPDVPVKQSVTLNSPAVVEVEGRDVIVHVTPL